MNPATSLPAMAGVCSVPASVLGHAVVRMDSAALKAARLAPLNVPGEPLAPPFLKNADEQTVAGLTAVVAAIQDHGLAGTDFSRWGVVAAPRFFARGIVSVALKRFASEGAWGISPHLIPNRSLHSVSGTVSQALKIHGPNLGVGGGLRGASKAMLAAAALLEGEQIPGIWLVLTTWNWEPGLDYPQPFTEPAICTGVALAIAPAHLEEQADLRLNISASPVTGHALAKAEAARPFFTLEALADALEGSPEPMQSWLLDCGGAVELEKVRAVAEKPS